MGDEAEKPGDSSWEEVEKLRREIEALRQRLADSAQKGKQLSWDTELLIRKTQPLTGGKIVSCADPAWQETLEGMAIGPEGICITDVTRVEHIEHVAGFAAKRQLVMTYGNRSFHLEPRRT